MENWDYYTILGITTKATQEEIVVAYRRLVMQYHPDISPHPDANERMQQINSAYAVLKDKEKRKEYDDMLSRINTKYQNHNNNHRTRNGNLKRITKVLIPSIIIFLISFAYAYWSNETAYNAELSNLTHDSSPSTIPKVVEQQTDSRIDSSPSTIPKVVEQQTDAKPYQFVKSINVSKNDEYFSSSDMAIDSSGNIYIINLLEPLVLKFDNKGNLIDILKNGGMDNNSLSEFQGITIDHNDNVYVTQTLSNYEKHSNDRILKFDSNGDIVSALQLVGNNATDYVHLESLDIDSQGSIYAIDNYYQGIRKFDSNGNLIKSWLIREPLNAWSTYQSIVVDNKDNVYVIDFSKDEIQKFDSNGNFLTTIGSKGRDFGKFNNLGDMAIDSNNNLYVTDKGNYRIQKFDSNGNFLTTIGSYGYGAEEYIFMDNIAVDSSGQLFIMEEDTLKVYDHK